MKEKMIFFFSKNVSEHSNPPDELAQKCFEKQNPRRTNYSSICSSKVQNMTVFSIIYMIRIRFFGSGELIQNGFRRARYAEIHARRDALSDFSSSLLGLATARQTSRPFAPQSSCLESKGGDVDMLPDVSSCCQIEWWIWFLIQCILVDFV